MVLASPLFLSIYMPLLGICYACAPLRLRNAVLLLACVVFYGAGAGDFFFLLVGLTLLTVVLGRFAYQNRLVSAGAIVPNLAPLVYYKYSKFFGNIILTIHGIANHPLANGL